MTWSDLKVERGEITVLTVDRPEAKNAIHFSTMDEMEQLLDELEADRALRALVLTGGGDTFVSGGDLKSFQSLTTAESGQRMAERMTRLLSRLSALPVPVIAAINGPAVGGGTEVALACDLRIIAGNAYFAFRQIAMAIMTAWGGGPRLIATLGSSRALYYLLTAERIPAEKALAIGLVHRVAPAGGALTAALDLAKEIAAQPPLAVRTIKQAVQRMAALPFDEASRVEVRAFATLWASADHDEAVDAYFNKRRPIFRGE